MGPDGPDRGWHFSALQLSVSSLRSITTRALLVGVPLTLLGGAFAWDALHPESILLFILFVPGVVLKYMNVLTGTALVLAFACIQFTYYCLLVAAYDLFRSARHRRRK